MFEAFPHVQKAFDYAYDVVEGKIPACKWIKLACQRFLDDLQRTDELYYFDPHAAAKACNFIENLPHTKGKWAAQRQKISLEPFQCFFLINIFGWKRTVDDTRRFRKALLLLPRKNGKSLLAAGVGLYMFCADGEFGAEVYSGATNEKQAWEVFKPAMLMAKNSPALLSYYGVTPMTSNLNKLSDGAKFEPMIGKPGDGSSPHCAIIDEYHEHDTDVMLDTMQTGMGAREQPLLLVITTAGDNLAGPCYAMQQDLQRVLENVSENDEFFGLIYTVDPTVDWTSDAALRMANPNYDVSVFGSFLQSQQKEAIQSARKVGIFKTKHLNVWVQARNAYFNVQKWMEAACVGPDGKPKISLEDFHNQPVILALDLASKVDIAAKRYVFKLSECNCDMAKVLRDEGYKFAEFGKYYLPKATVDAPENEHYQKWEIEGNLTVTDGDMIDYITIREDIYDDRDIFQVKEVAFDPHQAMMMMSELIAEGIPCVEVRPLVLNFSDPMKEIDGLIRSKAIAHNGDEPYTWMLSNVVSKRDLKDNDYPNKDRHENKIDGPVANIMAHARWAVHQDTPDLGDFLRNVVSG